MLRIAVNSSDMHLKSKIEIFSYLLYDIYKNASDEEKVLLSLKIGEVSTNFSIAAWFKNYEELLNSQIKSDEDERRLKYRSYLEGQITHLLRMKEGFKLFESNSNLDTDFIDAEIPKLKEELGRVVSIIEMNKDMR